MAVAIGGNIYKYFDSDKFSDVTIKIHGEDIKAHKLVLAQGSEYFRACLDGEILESKGSVIWLYEDDATAMKWLIKHLYGYNFGTFIDTELQGSAKDTRDIKQSNALYVVGQKYLVPEVCTEAKTTLTALLAHLPLTDEASSENFAEFVKYVCVDYQDEAIELRELLVAHFTDNVKYVADKDRCRAVFKDVPEFAFDVMEHVMQEDDRGGSKGKAALQKKRKMSRRTSIGQHQY